MDHQQQTAVGRRHRWSGVRVPAASTTWPWSAGTWSGPSSSTTQRPRHAADQDHRAARRHGPALLLRLRRRRLPGLLLVPGRTRRRPRRVVADRAARTRASLTSAIGSMNHVAFSRSPRADRRLPGPAAWRPGSTAPTWPITTTASGASPTTSTPGCSCARSTSRIPTASSSSSPVGPGRSVPTTWSHLPARAVDRTSV